MTTEDKKLAENNKDQNRGDKRGGKKAEGFTITFSIHSSAVLIIQFSQPKKGCENSSANAFACSDLDDATDSDGEYTPSSVSKSCKQQDQVIR
jgi:hypothetical protein